MNIIRAVKLSCTVFPFSRVSTRIVKATAIESSIIKHIIAVMGIATLNWFGFRSSPISSKQFVFTWFTLHEVRVVPGGTDAWLQMLLHQQTGDLPFYQVYIYSYTPDVITSTYHRITLS